MTLFNFIIFSLVSSFSFASEIEVVWRKIDTQYTFKDSNKECSTKTMTGNTHIPGQAYLALELVDGRVSAARFSNYPNTDIYKWIYKAIDLDASEVSSIELYKDPKNQYWLKNIGFTERLFKWLVHFPAKDHFWCGIPFIPQSISPKSIKTAFEIEGLQEGIEVSYSDMLNLKGTRPDGVDFEESLRIVQRKTSQSGE